jgi:AraC-like DNA-binding protein
MHAATVDELARDPVGRFVAGPTYAHFCVDASLWGMMLWGRPNEQDAVDLGRSLVLELAPPARPHASIVDASRLRGGDVTAFAALDRYLTRHAEALAKQVQRLALVRPTGLEGAIVAGAFEVLPCPYPVAIFEDVPRALGWLGAAGDHAAIAAALEGVFAAASGTPPLLGALRSWLDGHLGGPGVAAAAAALRLSERSLQRKLGELDTTFQDEVAAARVRAAERLLLESDAPLTTVALEVGCGSLQHFSALFRRRTGESPSAWRARRRR